MSAPALLACAAAALALALPVVATAGALEAGQRAAGVADAAALAAADAAAGWITAEPCEIAAELATASGMQLGGCAVDERSGEARVTVIASTLFGPIEVRARAGPPFAE